MKILLVWPYSRADWIEIFKKLSDQFDFIFLSYLSKDVEPVRLTFGKSIFWSDYQDSRAIIAAVAPEKIIFMTLDSPISISLNIQARQANIPTYIMQHGLVTNYRDYRLREKKWKRAKTIDKSNALKKKINFNSMKFVFRSVSLMEYTLIFLYSFFVRTVGIFWASKNVGFRQKKPDFYIALSPLNSILYKEMDQAHETQFIYIGSWELDKFLSPSTHVPQAGSKFYLLLDQALAENSFGEETVSKEAMINFYRTLNAFCRNKGAKFFIKLHPESYTSAWLPEDENIVYLRNNEDLNDLIQASEGCFGFYSTLIIPAIYWKPVILFKTSYSFVQERLQALQVVKVLDFQNIKVEDINFSFEKKGFERFKMDFFCFADGSTLRRLKEVLRN